MAILDIETLVKPFQECCVHPNPQIINYKKLFKPRKLFLEHGAESVPNERGDLPEDDLGSWRLRFLGFLGSGLRV